jgi:hypothetical protein
MHWWESNAIKEKRWQDHSWRDEDEKFGLD